MVKALVGDGGCKAVGDSGENKRDSCTTFNNEDKYKKPV